MLVSQFTHEGTTYNFEPPIETGDRMVEDIAELIALAQKGPNLTGGELKVARLTARLVLANSESDQLHTLNSLMHGAHQVTVA